MCCWWTYTASGDVMKRIAVIGSLILLLTLSIQTGRSVRPTIGQQTGQGTVGCVALTFDDGPSPQHTARLLDGLKARGVHATFFLIGECAEQNAALVRRMQAEGHQIGNHSYDHAQLTALPTERAAADLVRGDLTLCTLLGEGDYWMRPPYGSISAEELAAWSTPVICWSVDPEDWKCQDSAAVRQRVLAAVEDGDIILLHDCYASTVDAALQLVDDLQERGFRAVTVAELMREKGVEPEAGRIYYRIG